MQYKGFCRGGMGIGVYSIPMHITSQDYRGHCSKEKEGPLCPLLMVP